MKRQFTASALSACNLMVTLLAFVAFGGCKHFAPPATGLKATAAGTAIVESSGGHQVGVTGTALKDPLVVQVNDDQGTAVPGALVEFHGPADVSFDPAAALTDSSGQATYRTASTRQSYTGQLTALQGNTMVFRLIETKAQHVDLQLSLQAAAAGSVSGTLVVGGLTPPASSGGSAGSGDSG